MIQTGLNVFLSFLYPSWEMGTCIWETTSFPLRIVTHAYKWCNNITTGWITCVRQKLEFANDGVMPNRIVSLRANRTLVYTNTAAIERGGTYAEQGRALYICRTSINIVIEHTTHQYQSCKQFLNTNQRFDRGKSHLSSLTHIWSVHCCLGNIGGRRPHLAAIINHPCWE